VDFVELVDEMDKKTDFLQKNGSSQEFVQRIAKVCDAEYLSWIRQSRSDSTCYPLDVVDLVDEMDKKINPLAGEVHWVHNVHLVHGLMVWSKEPRSTADFRFMEALRPARIMA